MTFSKDGFMEAVARVGEFSDPERKAPLDRVGFGLVALLVSNKISEAEFAWIVGNIMKNKQWSLDALEAFGFGVVMVSTGEAATLLGRSAN